MPKNRPLESTSAGVTFRPIGVLRTLHTKLGATPIQPVYARRCPGRAELRPELAAGLADLEGFSHVYLLYWLHRAPRARLRVRPFLQDVTHGVFATRHPARPNPLGLSLVRLVRREGGMLHFLGADMLDGTPLLDIKPYARRYDAVAKPRGGWTEEVDEVTARRRGRRQRVATEAATLPAEAAGGRRRPRRQSES